MAEKGAVDGQHESGVEKIGQFVTREWLDNGRIAVYHIYSITREAVDEWITSAQAIFRSWPDNAPFLVIYDFSECGGITLTPYIRKRSQDLAEVRPELRGRAAIVLPRTIGTQAVRMFILINLQKTRIRRVFFSMEEALRWIRNTDAED